MNIYIKQFFIQKCLKQKNNETLDVITELRAGIQLQNSSFERGKYSNSIEIKSDIDHVIKAIDQITDYQKMFPLVSLISSNRQIESINKHIPLEIGLIVLKEDLAVEIIRKPKYNDTLLDKKTMFYTLRRYEYEKLIFDYYKYIPDVPSGKIFTACLNLAMEIPMNDFYQLFRKNITERVHAEDSPQENIPAYLVFIAKKSSLNRKEKTQFIHKVLEYI